jgi:hypothetical protein
MKNEPMIKELSVFLNPSLIEELKRKILKNEFKGLSFKQAMEFILTDGLMPESALPVDSILRLETWVRSFGEEQVFSYSATELKNKTGEILERVLAGNPVRLHRHGRVIAEIKRV